MPSLWSHSMSHRPHGGKEGTTGGPQYCERNVQRQTTT